jgi:hypothetical protein
MITLATGDTFQLKCKVKASPTAPTSLAGYAISSMVKTSDGVRHPAAVSIDSLPSVAWFVRIESAVTAGWPGGVDENDPKSYGEWDCKLVKDGITVHTEKRPVRIIKSVTV